MGDWTDAVEALVAGKIAGLDAPAVAERWAWATELGARAAELLDPARLRARPPEAVYDDLRRLGVPQCPIRLANLGRVNDAERIVASLLKLLETPGGFVEKYRAAKFPQAGLVTITELLCVARPARFICRSASFTRALAKVTPFYGYAALCEMGYEEFLDVCRVLTGRLERFPSPAVAALAARWRYLFLYAALMT